MNKKQLEVTLTLVILMGVLLIGEKFFYTNIQRVTLTNNNIGDLIPYSALEGGITYSLPDSWDVEEKKYPGNYIIYDNSFISDDKGIVGYVQIINVSKHINEVINDDKIRLKEDSINSYKLTTDMINGEEIKKATYKERDNNEKIFINTIYYKQISDRRVLKVLFSTSEEKYSNSLQSIYNVILNSFNEGK